MGQDDTEGLFMTAALKCNRPCVATGVAVVVVIGILLIKHNKKASRNADASNNDTYRITEDSHFAN